MHKTTCLALSQNDEKKCLALSQFPSAKGMRVRVEFSKARLLWPRKKFRGLPLACRCLLVAESGDPSTPAAGDALGAF